MNFNKFKALTFDCYGTLIDWESGIVAALEPWADHNGLAASSESLLEAYAQAESAIEEEAPDSLYTDVLRRVMTRIGETFEIPVTPEDADRLADCVVDWPPFPDTLDALKRLKERFKLIVVSNVDLTSFARSNAQLGVGFDAIVSAEEVGAYKPDHRMFLRAFDVIAELGVARNEILHVAQSLYHDHVPAKELNMATVWVDRRHGRSGSGATRVPDVPVQPDCTVASLAEFVVLL